MPSPRRHSEGHYGNRSGWLRAAVLGANDGIVSTASLLLGVAAAGATQSEILLTGVAALVAGALSMAAGEYVSVSSQADIEKADLARERAELKRDPGGELRELQGIYIARGLDAALARQVADQLMQHDALGAHARDELGLIDTTRARPLLAATASASAFGTGAALPLAIAAFAPNSSLMLSISAASLLCLLGLGAMAAKVGGANVLKGAARVGFWGALAMAITSGVGSLIGAAV